MKLKDIINAAGHRLDWVDFHWDWNIDDNGDIIPVTYVNINMDSDVSIDYLWFPAFCPDIDKEDIQKAIQSHDYETFNYYHKQLLDVNHLCLPSFAYIVIDGETVGRVFIADSPDMFSLIINEYCDP